MDKNILFRTVEKRQQANEDRYIKYGFSRNPFPSRPGVTINGDDARENGSIYTSELREKEADQFKKILIPSHKRPESKTIAFLMDYATRQGRGIGKTAFLNYQKKSVNNDFGYNISEG